MVSSTDYLKTLLRVKMGFKGMLVTGTIQIAITIAIAIAIAIAISLPLPLPQIVEK